MALYASDKFKLTNFLIEHSQAFQEYFIRKEFDSTVTTLYAVDDIYKQIEHTVYSVSDNAHTFLQLFSHNCIYDVNCQHDT